MKVRTKFFIHLVLFCGIPVGLGGIFLFAAFQDYIKDTALFAQLDQLKMLSFALSGFFALCLIGASALFVNKFMAPIAKLKKAMKKVEEGDLDVVFDIRSNDEIGSLLNDFKAMTKKLHETTISKDLLDEEVQKRKEKEWEILRLNTQLEKKIQERTQQLEESNKDLESFSYSISHDLKAPLRHMVSYAELIEKKSISQLEPSMQKYFEVIKECSGQMNDMIEGLLNYSRVVKQSLKKETVDMNQVVQEVVAWYKSEFEKRKISFYVASLPAVIGDVSMIKMVLSNLLSNALKFTKKTKSPVIKIGFHFFSDEECAFFVKDNGVGFDQNYSKRMFHVFQRLQNETLFSGDGIGLANVRRIVLRHGGKVWAEGVLGHGATIYFTLPFSKEETGYVEFTEKIAC